MLESLEQRVRKIIDQVAGYQDNLRAFEQQMMAAHQALSSTVAKIQEQEAELKAETDSINSQIAALNKQIATDRDAIAKAREQSNKGIFETVFGVVFAGLTGGASLILAGIGVASIVEGEEAISNLESQISRFQEKIGADQVTLSNDQKIVATLGVLLTSTSIILGDTDQIETTLGTMRASWTTFGGELAGVVAKCTDSMTASDATVASAWYDAAVLEWNVNVAHADAMADRAVTTNRVRVG